MANITYKYLKDPATEGENKLPRQAVVIVNELKAIAKDKHVSREDLMKSLEDDSEAGNKLNARQPVERVIAFYQKRLVDGGYIEMIKETPPKAEKKAKGDAGKAGTKAPADPAKTTADLKA